MRFGAHVPTRGRLASAIDHARDAGCDTLQVFVSNPRGWAPPNHSADATREFARRRDETGFGPAFAHSTYLVNVASPDDAFRERSVELARRELDVVAAMGGDGLVVHAGAGGPGERVAAVERAAEAILRVAGEGNGPPVLLELTAGGAGTVASTIPEAAALLDACGRHPRLGLCLDTCHLFAAGYPLDRPEGAIRLVRELRRHRLIRRLRLLHTNDARDPAGSRRDRHEHVGRGFIGQAGFRSVLSAPEVARVPGLIEVPGGVEDIRRDVEMLQRLAGV